VEQFLQKNFEDGAVLKDNFIFFKTSSCSSFFLKTYSSWSSLEAKLRLKKL